VADKQKTQENVYGDHKKCEQMKKQEEKQGEGEGNEYGAQPDILNRSIVTQLILPRFSARNNKGNVSGWQTD